MEQYEIHDDNGCIHSGTRDEIFLIWDLTTRTIIDLANEYRRTYTIKELEQLYKEKVLTEWKGDLKLMCVYNVFR